MRVLSSSCSRLVTTGRLRYSHQANSVPSSGAHGHFSITTTSVPNESSVFFILEFMESSTEKTDIMQYIPIIPPRSDKNLLNLLRITPKKNYYKISCKTNHHLTTIVTKYVP